MKTTFICTLWAATAVLTGAVRAEDEEPEPVDSFASGGAISAGGGFTFQHSVGKAFSGQSVGRDGITVHSGSWGRLHIVHDPDAPTLRCSGRPGQGLILYWLAAADDFILEQSSDLKTWTPVTTPLSITASHFMVTEPMKVGGRKFYRLKRDSQ